MFLYRRLWKRNWTLLPDLRGNPGPVAAKGVADVCFLGYAPVRLRVLRLVILPAPES